MPAYVVSIVKIENFNDGLKEYVQKAAEFSAKMGGKYVVRGPAAEIFEGDYLEGRSVVVSEWPDMDALHAFYKSDEYQNNIKPLREGTGIYDLGAWEAAE